MFGQCDRIRCSSPATLRVTVTFWNGGRRESEELCADCAELVKAWGLNAPTVQRFDSEPIAKRPNLGAVA